MKYLKLIGKYFLNILVSIDQLVNSIGFGSPDETISSRLGRSFPNSILAKVVNAIFFWDKNHVKKYIEPIDKSEDAILR